MEETVKTENQITLSKKDLNKSWWYWVCWGQICYNYERMMGLGFCQSMIPVLKGLYGDDKEKLAEGMTRHLTFYNTENTWGAVIPGIVASLEEGRANGQDIDDETIDNLKTGLMGPLAGLGDSITQSLVKVILLSIAIDMAVQGSIVGVLIFVLGFSAYALGVSHFVYFQGYKFGKTAIMKILGNGMIKDMTEALGALGMMILGGLIANNIPVKTALTYSLQGMSTEVQGMLDSILPNLLSVATFGVVVYMLRKGWKPTKIRISLMLASVVLGFFGILA